jgi:hypothetical protein
MQRASLSLEVAQRVRYDPGAFGFAENARSESTIQPALESSGEFTVVFLFDLWRPWWFRMAEEPFPAFLDVSAEGIGGNRIGQTEGEEKRRAHLVPVRRVIAIHLGCHCGIIKSGC